MKPYLICLLLLQIVECLRSEGKDYALSVAGLKVLIDLEASFIGELAGYEKDLQLKIDTIESFLNEVRSKQTESQQSPEDYVAHPLNSFSLIRRLHEDWSYFEKYMSQPVGAVHIENITKLAREEAPQLNDVVDAMEALIRLQIFHELHAVNLTKGLIDGRQYNSQLTVLETLRMAQYCFEDNLHRYALDWFKVSIELFHNTKDELSELVYNLTMPRVYGDYFYLLSIRGYAVDALETLNKISDMDVDFWLYRRSIEETAFYLKDRPQFVEYPKTSFQIGCLAQYPVLKHFTCHLQRNLSHFLTLAPLKVETLSLHPYVVLFHDVIYDKEIQELKSVNLSSLKHHRFETPINTMKRTIVERDVNDVLNNRVKDMTGMQIGEDKDFMLINFGLGGHTKISESAERLVTIIFFLSDVPQGGATVFNELEIEVKPKKGSAVLWHSESNQRSIHHSSCPVIVGSKWTLVKRLNDRSMLS